MESLYEYRGLMSRLLIVVFLKVTEIVELAAFYIFILFELFCCLFKLLS